MNDAVNTFLEATRKEHEFTNKDGVVTSFFGLGKMLKVRPDCRSDGRHNANRRGVHHVCTGRTTRR